MERRSVISGKKVGDADACSEQPIEIDVKPKKKNKKNKQKQKSPPKHSWNAASENFQPTNPFSSHFSHNEDALEARGKRNLAAFVSL